jgi:hypothetical protein
MSNPVKNVTPVSNPKVEVATGKESVENQALTVQEPKTESPTTLKVVEVKTATTVFERLEEGLKMKEIFNKSKERVGEFEDFAKNYADEGLVMKIENIGTSDSIQIQNVAMILEFIHNLVKTGKAHLKQLEGEIINFSI